MTLIGVYRTWQRRDVISALCPRWGRLINAQTGNDMVMWAVIPLATARARACAGGSSA
jgi:hypothetical protein